MKNAVLSMVLAGVLLGPLSFAWSQQAPTCTVTETATGVCVKGSVLAPSEPIMLTLTHDVLCIERTATGRTLRRQATLTNQQQVTAPTPTSSRRTAGSQTQALVASVVAFEVCVGGTLTPPCPDDALVNVDELTLTTQPEIPGCVLPTTDTTP